MKKINFTLYFFIYIFFFCLCTHEENPDKEKIADQKQENSQQSLSGLWQLVEKKVIQKDGSSIYPFHVTFKYDEKTVIVSLVSLSSLPPKSDDDVYRLDSKMVGDTLFYNLPYGDKWIKLAYTKNGSFYTFEGGKEWQYEKISAEKIVPWNKAILKDNRPVTN